MENLNILIGVASREGGIYINTDLYKYVVCSLQSWLHKLHAL